MELIIALLVIVILLDIAALRWGKDSRDVERGKWERREWNILFPAHHES
jgi:type II secretory pathway pseudopilin PulG